MAVEIGRACITKCRRMGYEGALYYGMVKEYAETRGWGLWEVFREVVQNALDEMHDDIGYRPTIYPCTYRPEIRGSVVYDTGRGIATQNLYIGKSEKKTWQRGKFGEGLKIALLTAVANNINVIIHSMDKEFRPTLAKEDVEDVTLDVFCICIKRLPVPVTGTQVYFPRMGDLCSKFWNKVVQGIMDHDPKSILISIEDPRTMEWYDVIDKKATNKEGWIFARDLFVTSSKEATYRDACYSYNLYDVKLDESRRIASISSAMDEINILWDKILISFDPDKVETDEFHKRAKKVLKEVLSCLVKDCKANAMLESDKCIFSPWKLQVDEKLRIKLRQILDEVVGKDVWILHDKELSNLAIYLGVKHILCTTRFGSCAQSWFDMRKVFEEKIREKFEEIIPRDKLDPVLRARLEILEKIAKKLFVPTTRVKVEYMLASPEVKGAVVETPVESFILINIYHLTRDCNIGPALCIKSYLETYGHELAHIESKSGDLTPQHLTKLTELMGEALSRAIEHYDSVYPLVKQLHETYTR